MDLITGLFDMDFAALVPEVKVLLGTVRAVLTLAVLAGPITLLVLGALYLFAAPKEANYKFGFRTYYGMGGVEAWRFSQRIAGMAFGALGAGLLIVMFIVVLGFGGKDAFQMAQTAITCLLWQGGLVLIARLVVAVYAWVYFDANGNRRR